MYTAFGKSTLADQKWVNEIADCSEFLACKAHVRYHAVHVWYVIPRELQRHYLHGVCSEWKKKIGSFLSMLIKLGGTIKFTNGVWGLY